MTKISRSQYNELLVEQTDKKKTEWAEEIKGIAPLIRTNDPNDMTEASALGLSYRVQLLEDIGFFLSELVSEQKIIKQLKRDKFCLYATGLNIDGTRPTGSIMNNPLIGISKLNGSQRDMIISGDIAEYEHSQEILTNTIDQLREYVKTIDSFMFAIKNRLEIFQILK